MSSIRVLAFSSSRVANSGYLEMAAPAIKNFLGDQPLNIAFIPFAAADNEYDNYLAKVSQGLSELPHHITVVKPGNAKASID